MKTFKTIITLLIIAGITAILTYYIALGLSKEAKLQRVADERYCLQAEVSMGKDLDC